MKQNGWWKQFVQWTFCSEIGEIIGGSQAKKIGKNLKKLPMKWAFQRKIYLVVPLKPENLELLLTQGFGLGFERFYFVTGMTNILTWFLSSYTEQCGILIVIESTCFIKETGRLFQNKIQSGKYNNWKTKTTELENVVVMRFTGDSRWHAVGRGNRSFLQSFGYSWQMKFQLFWFSIRNSCPQGNCRWCFWFSGTFRASKIYSRRRGRCVGGYEPAALKWMPME